MPRNRAGSNPPSTAPDQRPTSGPRRQRPPAVDRLAKDMPAAIPARVRVELARGAIHTWRTLADDDHSARPELAEIVDDAVGRWQRSLVGEVINGTGVLLHTNLGRAPQAASISHGYSNIELDTLSGERGERAPAIPELLRVLTNTPDACVVNNGAAAIFLALAAHAQGARVIVSRGELVEIGGGFRIPEILVMANCDLVEVGTTNKTRLADYEKALAKSGEAERPAHILKVHPSNYRMSGFTGSVPIGDLRRLIDATAATHPKPLLIVDQGTGLLDNQCPWLEGAPPAWIGTELGVAQMFDAGADLICYSADKLLGGPQAGIVAGATELVQRCRRHPMMRTFRTGAAITRDVQQILMAYADGRGQDIPLWHMASIPVERLWERAERICQLSGHGEAALVSGRIGGGTLPETDIPSAGIKLRPEFVGPLRAGRTPIIARTALGCAWIDLRTVRSDQDQEIIDTLRAL